LRWRKPGSAQGRYTWDQATFVAGERRFRVNSAQVARGDIVSRDDIIQLVDGFYTRVQKDDVLGPIFNDIARVDWAAHLPKMYDFWESVLFGTAQFKGNPLAVHRALASRAPMTGAAFERWIVLFHKTVDELFDGAMAAQVKDRAERIAMTMQYHIETDEAVASGGRTAT
jgi:hemoglobin